jgi:phospholipid/cholesterol/gamma-HCH transport system substrate-binding protein
MDLKPGAALLRMEDGDTLHGAATPQITQLAADLGAKASSALNAFDSLLSPQAVRDVQATAAVLPASAAELRAALSELKLTAAALRRTAEGVAEAETGAAVTSAVNEVEKSARALTTAIGTIEGSFARSLGSFETVMARIDRGDGTLGRLVNDSTLYVEMSNTLREMRMLAGDIRERPGRYFTVRIF